jgi:hypothetical protein
MTVMVGRREPFSAAHQLCDPELSEEAEVYDRG